MATMDMNKLREAASRIWNAETLPALKTFVSRESLSTDFDPEWEKHGILNEVCRAPSVTPQYAVI